jgi:hypothetical protein
VLQYAIRKADGSIVRYSTSNHEDSVYVAAQFPFTLFKDGFDKTNASEKDVIVQLTLKTDVNWQGKTEKEYLQDENQYYLSHDPALTYKVMRYAPVPPLPECNIIKTTGECLNLQDLPGEKNILILHQDLECSGCINALYQLLNQTESEKIRIGNVYAHPLNGMSAYEISSRIRPHLSKPFTLYSCSSPDFSTLTSHRHIPVNEFPCLILYDKNGLVKLYTASELFSTNLNMTSFKTEFLDQWQSFISSQ